MPAMPMRGAGRRQRVVDRQGGPFETAFDASPSGLALLDNDGVVVRANPALPLCLGAAPDDVTGLTLADYKTFDGPAARALRAAVR